MVHTAVLVISLLILMGSITCQYQFGGYYEDDDDYFMEERGTYRNYMDGSPPFEYQMHREGYQYRPVGYSEKYYERKKEVNKLRGS